MTWRQLCGGGIEGASNLAVYTAIPTDERGRSWRIKVRPQDGAPALSDYAASYCYGIMPGHYGNEFAARSAIAACEQQIAWETERRPR